MVSELACQPRRVERFFPTEEERAERFFQPKLSLNQLKKIYSNNFLAAALTNKLGVFVSTPKNVFPKAVERNKIKRRIKSIMFELGFSSNAFGLKLVIRKDFLDLNYKEAYNEIKAVTEKAYL